MTIFFRLAPLALLLLTACGAPEACAPPHRDWPTAVPAGTASDAITLDADDLLRWNGQVISLQRLRGTLNEADAKARAVAFSPAPGASCAAVEAIRLAMVQSLSCGQGRCIETAP